MRFCRFNGNRLGLVEGDQIIDVTPALEVIPAQRWPLPEHDLLIAHLDEVLARANAIKASAPRLPIGSVVFNAPVANPGKIVNAPINYQKHINEAVDDKGIAHGRDLKGKHITDWGLFLKATSSMIGFGEEVRLRKPERRNDHEIELAVIIGRTANKVKAADALKYVAGYSMGLDMTIRGPELQCFRKSVDTYAVLGPWIVTADEIADPNNLNLAIWVNGEARQNANTNDLVYNVNQLIEYATEWYTLHPGDVILTGTPEGVGPVKPGDTMTCEIERIGRWDVKIASEFAG
jgi:2-keto-4-pentenoate hydratase/2-oxohepta-3-ene-1,7-dioic acid hydratase in catechol pathway